MVEDEFVGCGGGLGSHALPDPNTTLSIAKFVLALLIANEQRSLYNLDADS